MVPAQILLAEAVMLTLGTTVGKTVTEMELLEELSGRAHVEVVIITEISSPSVKLLLE